MAIAPSITPVRRCTPQSRIPARAGPSPPHSRSTSLSPAERRLIRMVCMTRVWNGEASVVRWRELRFVRRETGGDARVTYASQAARHLSRLWAGPALLRRIFGVPRRMSGVCVLHAQNATYRCCLSASVGAVCANVCSACAKTRLTEWP